MVSIGHTAKMASLKPANRPAVSDFNVLWLFQNSGAVASNNLCASAFDVNLDLSLTQIYVGLCQFLKAWLALCRFEWLIQVLHGKLVYFGS